MTATIELERLQLLSGDCQAARTAFARDVLEGLTSKPKRLSCRFFYDEEGSRLFEQICALPEYYLTRTERGILAERCAEIAAGLPPDVTLVELGSGSAVKTRLVIEALLERNGRLRYVPVDISPIALAESSLSLLEDYPALEICGLAAEYEEGLCILHDEDLGPKLVLWLGSNVGNLDRDAAAAFLGRVARTLEPDDRLLVGIDLRKEASILEPAYDDAAGVTARFNLNLLRRINVELGGDFNLDAFRHRAVYNGELGRIEMYLDSLGRQTARIEALNLDVNFAAGEEVHTENSHKYSGAEIRTLAARAGLRLERQWRDAADWFSVNLFYRDGA